MTAKNNISAKSNFDFLQPDFPTLYQIGSVAEQYLYNDTNSCLIKLGMFGETVVKYMFQLDSLDMPSYDNTHANRLKLLHQKKLLPYEINNILHTLRKTRNDAVHANLEDIDLSQKLLQMTFNLAHWFVKTYGMTEVQVPIFIMPKRSRVDYAALIAEKEALIAELSNQMQAIKAQNLSVFERRQKANKALSFMNLSEEETRTLIDEQLRRVGWEADTRTLRYANGTRPAVGRNMAIAEWPATGSGKQGYADYALFVGLKMVGLIEAKKTSVDVPSVIDNQGKEYARTIKDGYGGQVAEATTPYGKDKTADSYHMGEWNGYKVPFVFATNGRKYLEQIKTKSGIWFLDLRDNSNIPQVLQGWVSPDGIKEWLARDIEQANAKLTATPYDLLTDKEGLNLRPYQLDAIACVENSIKQGAKTVLLSMATGTGKTRTILGMIYRLLKANRFRRILFLVDRNALGIQAQDVFNEVKLEQLLTLNDIYNINKLEDKQISTDTKIQVATVQSMVKRLLHNEDDTLPAVSDYDLMIIDEAHRGYTLDQEMDENELFYRDQDDFVSTYRTIIDYFDAVKIALTATPALHTTEIFGKPVYNYSYREAVIDGYLVDHDAPHTIKTKLSTEGIKYQRGESVAIYDPITGEITNSDELEDELEFDIDQFNRRVITEDFNRTVLAEIAGNLDPEGEGKTLIYAVNDNHAELIVKILREIYLEQGIEQDAVMKITGSIGDRKRIDEAIRRFKNEQYPNIAVTVDLLTTGIDVPEITTLVFMRRVKSRILFEQMLGRATRLCDRIGKTHFEIYDPVGVYESLQDVSTMKPVVVSPKTDLLDLLMGLELPSKEQLKNQIDIIIAHIRRKAKHLTAEQQSQIESLAGGKNLELLLADLVAMPVTEAKTWLLDKLPILATIAESKRVTDRTIVIADKSDELISHTRGYGEGKKPADYLEEFNNFINTNIDRIEALKIVCTRPANLTREGLKSLRMILDQHGFTEIKLNNAHSDLTNEGIAADIISLIRAGAIGATILNHDDRIKNAVHRLKKRHNFSKVEESWLDRIEKHLLAETILTEDTFNTGVFRDKGGFKKIDQIFKNKLQEYIIELNEYLYDDGGKVA